MRCRVYHHRFFIRRIIGDQLIHIKKVAVFFGDGFSAISMYGIGKIQIHRTACQADPFAGVALGLGGSRCHITGHQIAEAGIFSFQIIIAIFFGNILGISDITGILRHPDATVVAKAFTHQGQFGLMLTSMRNTGGMNLGETGVGKHGPFAISPKSCADVGRFGVGGQIIHIAITARTQHHRIGGVAFQFTIDQISGDNAAGLPIYEHQIHHFPARH